MRHRLNWLVPAALSAALWAVPLTGQTSDSAWKPIAPAGVLRASALVDSVFVDRQLAQATVDAGDFAAYLMARLGASNLPPDFGYRVAIDASGIRIGGRVSDLPPEARQALAQLIMILPGDTRLEAQIALQPAGREAVRFHLQGASVHGIPIPETLVQPMMAQIGRQYPALTGSGRDLLVQVPVGGRLELVPGGVRLTGPP
jgi:hypothetical protein